MSHLAREARPQPLPKSFGVPFESLSVHHRLKDYLLPRSLREEKIVIPAEFEGPVGS